MISVKTPEDEEYTLTNEEFIQLAIESLSYDGYQYKKVKKMKRIIDYDKLEEKLKDNPYSHFTNYEINIIFDILREVEE